LRVRYGRAPRLKGECLSWRYTLYVNLIFAALAIAGPPGEPVARGVDFLTIRDGLASVVRTLSAPSGR
jgi:hypothetical protein